MRFSAVHWSGALALSLAVHAALTSAMAPNDPVAQIARGAGDPVMVVSDLASTVASVSSDDVSEAVEPVREAVEARETEEPKPVRPLETQTAETAPAEVDIETTNTVTPDQPETTAPEASKLLDAPLAAPKPAPPAKTKVVEPVPDPPEPQRKARTKLSAERPTSGSLNQARPGARPGDGGRNRTNTGRADISNYMGRVASRLQRQKRYPRAAKRRKLQGTVVVSFVIRSNGAVSGVRLARGSGHAVLDKEVLAMVRRASPFPPIPANAGRTTIPVTVPITFRRR